MKNMISCSNRYCSYLLLFFPVFVFSQNVNPKLIIPEGIKDGLFVKTIKDNDRTQLVLNEKNRIVVWDLIENKEKYNVKFSSEVLSLTYHPSGKYMYVSTEGIEIYILDSENGNIISQRSGSNYIYKNFSPFIGNEYLYVKDNQVYIASIFSEDDKKIEIQAEDFYIDNVNYDSASEKLFLFTTYTGIHIYDKNLQPYSKVSINDSYFSDYYVFDNKLFSYYSGSSPEFKVYDLNSGEPLNEITVKQEDYPAFYDKTKKYIGHYENRLFLYEKNSIIIKDIVTGKTIKSVPLKFKEVEDIVLSENGNFLMIYGNIPFVDEFGYDTTVKDIQVYDLMDYSLKEFDNQIKSQSIWTANEVVFDNENFFVYRFAQDQILKNSILTGTLESSYQVDKEKEIDVYSSNPIIVNDKYILIVVIDENLKRNLYCLDSKSNKILWTFDKIENSFFEMKVDEKQQLLTIIDESFPNNNYTILDIVTGETLYSETSTEKLFVSPVSKHKILKLLSYRGGDWKNPVYELHISEYNPENKTTTEHKIPFENSAYIDDVLQKNEYLYVKYTDKLLTFNLNDLSKTINSVNIDMQDYRLIDIHNNEYFYIQSIAKDRTFKAYSLTDENSILEQEDLTFIDYVKPLNQILVKDSKNDLYQFDITTQQLSTTGINLSQVDLYREFKIHHDKWLVYKADKNQIIYDLENNRIKHQLDNFIDVEFISKDGNLYYNYGVIKRFKDGSDFSDLANEKAIPQSISEVSLGINPDEVIYLDNNGLLNILNLAENQKKTFQFSPSSSKYDRKYEQLSSNLFLLSSENEFTILNTDNNKLINLSENAIEIQNFEIDNKLLIVTENDKLNIFDLNNAKQIFENKSFNHRQLNNSLVIFDDSKRINLYSTKTNRILWENEIPRKTYKSYFSTILDNTVFVINEDIVFALDIRTGNIKSSYTISSIVNLFYSEPITIHPQTKQIYVNTGNDIESKYEVFEYKNNQFVKSDVGDSKNIDITKLKEEYHIDEDDNFSLNDNILAVHKRPTNVFLVYDTKTQSVLLKQKIEVNDAYSFTWDVSDSEKIIFMYNNSGGVVLIDYGNNKVHKYKVNGNKFRIDNHLLFVSDYGKKIDVYDLTNADKLTKMYSLIPLPKGEYMFYTDEGYYLSTKEAAKNIQFKLNGNLYSFEQFDLIYNRPDLVLKAMQSTNTDLVKMYENAYQKRLNRQEYTITTSSEITPDIEIVNKELIQSGEGTFDLKIKANGKSERLSKIVITVNDNLYKEISVKDKTFVSTEKIELNQGNNHIEVYAIDKNNVKSISDKTEVFLQKKDFESSKVYFFGIGVSDYQNDDFDLKYAAKDIRDMADAFSERYSDIEINLLLDDEVTVENINAFKQKLEQLQVNDVVIISFCGHGVLDKDYNWYFATHDLDFENPQKRGFSYENLIDMTNVIKSRQKLVTIDACHSGEVDIDEVNGENYSFNHQINEEQNKKVVPTKRGSVVVSKATKDGGTTSFALMKQMFSNLESTNGTIVISASGGMEYAFEGGNFKNGVFTYSILNLLDDSIWNTLKISELQKTVMERVYKLTDGKQQPNVRTGTLNYDWIVW